MAESFDDLVDVAWHAFAAELTSRLGILRRAHVLGLTPEDRPNRRLMVFTVMGSGKVRATLGQNLPSATGAVDDQMRELSACWDDLGEGWRKVRRRWVTESGRRDLTLLVARVVRVLRDILDVPHPSFIAVTDSAAPPLPPEPDSPPTPSLTDSDETCSTTPAIVITDNGCLLGWAQQVLSMELGQQLAIGGRGMIALPATDALPSRAYVPDAGHRVVFVATLTHRLTDTTLLATLLTRYSERFQGVSFCHSNGHVYAMRAVECTVFHPNNLVTVLAEWRTFVAEVGDELFTLMNPGGPGAHDCPDSDIPIGLQTLIDLFHDGDLTAHRIVHLTNGKVDKLRHYRAVCGELIEGCQHGGEDARERNAPFDEIAMYRRMAADLRTLSSMLDHAIVLVQRSAG
ncbi:TY-Chap domain-containing protein [Gordonia sp. NPDC003376]